MAAEKTFQEWWARYSYRFEPGRILENSARTCWNDAAKLSEDSKTSTNTASPKLPTNTASREICPSCDGSGDLRDGDKQAWDLACPACSGTGKLQA